MPDEQAQAHHQIVQVHRRQLGFIVRAKSKICSNNFIQVFDFGLIMRVSFARGSPVGNTKSSE